MPADPQKIPLGFEDPSFDFPQPTAPQILYMIASTPRAGGSLLSQQLWSSGILGAPAEYFGFYSTFLRLVARLQPDTMEEYLAKLTPLRTSLNGVFGFKAHFDHIQFMALTGLLSRMQQMRVVAIERRDHLAQAVSHARALQTGQWYSLNTNPKAPPSYNADLIRWSANHLDQQRRGWASFFEQHKLKPIRVDYDALAADPVSVGREVIDRLEMPRTPVTPVQLPSLERQADAINAEWIERFRREQGGL